MNRLRTVMFCVAAAVTANSAWAVSAGDPAPDFSLKAINGDATVNLKDFRGKVVYLDFWASWCPPCLKSMPLLNKMRGRLKDEGVEVIGVNVDQDEGDALGFLKEHPVDFPILKDVDGKTPDSFGLQAMPTSYVIDRNGVVRYVHEGFRDGDIGEIEAKIKDALKQK